MSFGMQRARTGTDAFTTTMIAEGCDRGGGLRSVGGLGRDR